MENRSPGVDRLRRSLHFVPGANEKMLAKALASAADSLVLDLEDAVTPKRKDAARAVIAKWLETVDFGHQERVVRMNPLDTPWGLADLEITMAHPPDAYLVPKVSSLEELSQIDGHLTSLEQRHGHRPGQVGLLLVSTETPLGVLNLPTFSQCSRVIGLTWGAEDLSAAIGAPRNRLPNGQYLDLYRHCRNQTLLCAAAGGVQPVDSVFVDISDADGLIKECQEGAWMGYTGKITIHPSQIDIVNTAFTPPAGDVEEARRLIAAFDEAQSQGLMAISFEGNMVDMPHLTRARRTISRAQQIAEHISGRHST